MSALYFRKMVYVYLGYDFDIGKIKNIQKKPICVKESLSNERLDKAKVFWNLLEILLLPNLTSFVKGLSYQKIQLL